MAPENATLYHALLRHYHDARKAADVYYGQRAENKPAFAKGLATARREGHVMSARAIAEHVRAGQHHKERKGADGD